MPERYPITNLLMLLILATFLLISGSLQSAFDSLTQADRQYNAVMRVADCHPLIQQTTQVSACANKACHQSTPQHRDIGGPEFYSLHKQAQPLTNSSRQQLPQLRSYELLTAHSLPQPLLLANYTPQQFTESQQLRSLRTTVLLY